MTYREKVDGLRKRMSVLKRTITTYMVIIVSVAALQLFAIAAQSSNKMALSILLFCVMQTSFVFAVLDYKEVKNDIRQLEDGWEMTKTLGLADKEYGTIPDIPTSSDNK